MKVKFKLPIEDFKILRQLSDEQGRTMMDVVRRGIYAVYWMRQQKMAGSRLLVKDARGKLWRVITNVV